MKIIDIIYPRSLAATIGPSQTIKRLVDSRNILIENGIELNVFDKEIKEYKGKSILKNVIKNKIFGSERIYAYLYLMRSEFNTLKFVNNYCNKNRNINIVQFHHVTAFIFFTFLNRKQGIKLILFQHNSGDISEMGKKQFPILRNSLHIKIIEKVFFRRINILERIIFISNYAKNNFDKTNQKFKNKTVTILNGLPDIDLNIDYKIKTNEPIKLITVGTVSKRKGQDIVLRALANINKEFLDKFHLTIVGEGPEYVQFKQLTTDLAIEKSVNFVGKKEQDDVFKLLSTSSIFVLMSHSEGLPLSLLEALRSGLPIITSNVDGCPETVSNNNGYIINPDVAELTNVLKNIKIKDLEKMSRNSRELFEKDFRYESFLKKYIQLISGI